MENFDMEKRTIAFSPPDITEAEIAAVAEAMRSGWITTGPRTKQFEQKIAEYCLTNRAVCLSSATACLESILRFLGVGPGDEVITSAYTYTASASPAVHVGAKPVLVDTAADSFEMDYEKLEAAITERTKVIVPVDIGGVPCDYARIYEIAERKRALFHAGNDIQAAFGRVIIAADSAHGFGAGRGSVRTGALADFTSFSFHAVKNLTTAEGGALTWKPVPGMEDEEIYRQFMLLSLHGQSKDALHKGEAGAWEYDVLSPAYKCNMTDITAAIGLVQLERYPGLLARRKELIGRYDAAVLPLGCRMLVHETKDYCSSGHLYLLRIPGITERQRNEVIDALAKRGISANVHYKPLPMLTAYRNLGFSIEDYPNAYAQYANEVTLPLHTKLADEDAAYIIENLTEIIKCMG